MIYVNLSFQIFPIVYVLMTRKTAEAYEAVFSYIEDNLFNMRLAMFMADFEGGIRKAINNCYPDAILRGCWYHYSAAIRRKCLSLNLYDLITDHPEVRILFKMILNLPLLPPEKILEGFSITKNTARDGKLNQEFGAVFKYFESFWLQLVGIPSIHIHISIHPSIHHISIHHSFIIHLFYQMNETHKFYSHIKLDASVSSIHPYIQKVKLHPFIHYIFHELKHTSFSVFLAFHPSIQLFVL